MFILNSVYDDGPFRLAMSRWLQRHTENTFHWVHGGRGARLSGPGRTDGLDFRAFYLQTNPEPFSPAMVDFARGDSLVADKSWS